MQQDLTQTINAKLSTLKTEVNNLPTGGGLEVLKDTLVALQEKVGIVVGDIDSINGVKTPENVHKKPVKTTIDNGFITNRGEGGANVPRRKIKNAG